MRLAVACGRHDVDGMLEDMSPQELDEWLAYYTVEPFGAEHLAGVVANAASAVCHALGAKVTPWMILGKEESQQELTPNQAAAFFRASNGHNR